MENLEFFEALGMTPMEDKLTPEQIGKVKGLGCLKDKRYDDIFNIRVVTRNGRITTDESPEPKLPTALARVRLL